MKILSEEEIDDQFLRLVEVLGCKIATFAPTYSDLGKYFIKDKDDYYIFLLIMPPYEESEKKIKMRSLSTKDWYYWYYVKNNKLIEENILSELKDIKNRIENMFPVEMKIAELASSSERYVNDFRIKIDMRKI